MLFWSKMKIKSAGQFIISGVLCGTNRLMEPGRQSLNNFFFYKVLCAFGGGVFLSQQQDGQRDR
jgi:hypothetical protein